MKIPNNSVAKRVGNLPSRNMTLIERQTLETRIKVLEEQVLIMARNADYWKESSDYWRPRAWEYSQLLLRHGIEIPEAVKDKLPKFNPNL